MPDSDALTHRFDRRIVLAVPTPVVFRFFTDSARWARWWGEGSSVDPSVGGAVRIRHPNGVQVGGTVLAVNAPYEITFTHGYASGSPVPEGGSTVTVSLKDHHEGGTKLRLTHAFAAPEPRDQHAQGWRYQLSVLANLAADEANADANEVVDAWFAAWSDPNEATRNAVLDRIVSPDVEFRDRYSLVIGLEDLRPHLAAVHAFMPGMTLSRVGETRHCQGLVLADWVARGADGQERGRGTNAFARMPNGHFKAVTGFWS